jgi:hypothetical protein
VIYAPWDNAAQRPACSASASAVGAGVLLQNSQPRAGRWWYRQNVIADGIVQLQAQYGRDTGVADSTVEVWDTTAPASADDWSRVLATSRSQRAAAVRKPTPPRGLETTAAAPVWSGGCSPHGCRLANYIATRCSDHRAAAQPDLDAT